MLVFVLAAAPPRQASAEVYKGMMKIHNGGEQQNVAIKRMVPEALQGLKNFQREARGRSVFFF